MYDNLNRLLYIETGYRPCIKIANELITAQAHIRQAYYDIEKEEKCGYQALIRKQSLANYIRSKWVLIECSDLGGLGKRSDLFHDQGNIL